MPLIEGTGLGTLLRPHRTASESSLSDVDHGDLDLDPRTRAWLDRLRNRAVIETSITTGSEPLTGHDLTSADGVSGDGLAIPALIAGGLLDFADVTVTAAGRARRPEPAFAVVTHTAAGPAIDARRGAPRVICDAAEQG